MPITKAVAYLLIALLLVPAVAGCAQVPQSQPAQPDTTATSVPAEPTQPPVEQPANTPAPVATEAEPTQAPAMPATGTGLRTFTLAPDRSEVRFTIDELLRGRLNSVVGVSRQVTGEVQLDSASPATTQIGVITVDAGSFVTDDNMRNGAIRRFILHPDQYPTVTFAPTDITGLPATVAVGDNFPIQVTGDLTILDQTHPETFDLTVNVNSESEIQVTGSTKILRSKYGLSMPSIPFVTDVPDEFTLELDLVAVAGAP